MALKNRKEFRRFRIKKRIRKVILGTSERPRLSIFRSNKEIYAQIIDDSCGKTLAAASTMEKSFANTKVAKLEKSKIIGQVIAERALEAGIDTVVFDRNGYLYHGRVKSLAEAAREGGLKF
jgi:large subunit ribosomal protein L18